MNDIQFSNSFGFNSYSFKNSRHTDNSGGTRAHHIGVVKEGRAVFEVGGAIHEFEKGDVFYTPLGCRYHSYWSGESIVYDSYSFLNFVSDGETTYGVQKLHMTDVAWRVLAALDADKTVTTKNVGLFYILLGEVQPFMQPTVRDSRREMFISAQSFMRENTDFVACDLARHLRISESGLYALFAEYGTTPVAEKNRLRAEAARELLENTDLTVEEISERLGFSSAAYFRKVLRKVIGKAPKEMRKGRGL